MSVLLDLLALGVLYTLAGATNALARLVAKL